MSINICVRHLIRYIYQINLYCTIIIKCDKSGLAFVRDKQNNPEIRSVRLFAHSSVDPDLINTKRK